MKIPNNILIFKYILFLHEKFIKNNIIFLKKKNRNHIENLLFQNFHN